MKCFILLAFVAAASALPAALVNTGASSQYRSQDNAGNYAFGYDESHGTGGTFRKETGSHGVKVGSYGLRDADGRVRTVNYVADAAGFRVNIQTNEPGVEPKDPAATLINKAHVVDAHAPLLAAPAIAAPLVAHAPAHYAHAPAVVAHAPAHYAAAPAHYAHAPAHYAAPIMAHHAPAYSGFSYTSAAVHAAPAHYAAAPLIAHAAPYRMY